MYLIQIGRVIMGSRGARCKGWKLDRQTARYWTANKPFRQPFWPLLTGSRVYPCICWLKGVGVKPGEGAVSGLCKAWAGPNRADRGQAWLPWYGTEMCWPRLCSDWESKGVREWNKVYSSVGNISFLHKQTGIMLFAVRFSSCDLSYDSAWPFLAACGGFQLL